MILFTVFMLIQEPIKSSAFKKVCVLSIFWDELRKTYFIFRDRDCFMTLYFHTYVIFGLNHVIIIVVKPAIAPPSVRFVTDAVILVPWPRTIDKNPMIRINAPRHVNGVE